MTGPEFTRWLYKQKELIKLINFRFGLAYTGGKSTHYRYLAILHHDEIEGIPAVSDEKPWREDVLQVS
jgi:hypothetical protein